jgi:DNA uptake protein ComE-like DNA-binding protein
MNDSLKLRKTARQIRYQALRPAIEKASELNAEQKKDVINFLSQSIGSPMVVMAKSPLPAFVPAPGPCMMPMGVEMVDPKTGKRFGLETSAICVLDIKSGGETLFSVKEALENDTLDLVLAHENAHGIQFDLYGKLFHKIQRTSTNGHDAPYITDLGMAYIEGWAEAFEAVYGPANPKLKEKDRKKYNISEFLYGRQDPIRRDRYVWANHVGKKTGTMKNGLQLMSTEGVVAGLYYDILTSRAINAPFEKCVQTMLTNPMDFVEFVKNFVQLFPEDKKVVYRILLENTNYVTLDKRAAEGYKNYYQYKLAYVQKKVSKQEYLKARDAYKNYTEALFKKAMAGADIFANVGPQMWFAGKVKLEKKTSSFKDSIAKKMGKDNDYWEFRMDLNTVTVKMLRNIGFAESDAAKIVEEREKLGFFTGNPVKVIEKLIGSERYPKYNAVFNFTNYDHKSADYVKDYVKQSIALWPEDIEKL